MMEGVMPSPAGCVTHPAELMPDAAFLAGNNGTLLRKNSRTRQISRLGRSISSRIVMFTKIGTQKKRPDAGKKQRVRQIF
jgi:hypothetical protein